MANGPWTIAGQVLALEPWRPNFYAEVDSITPTNLWVCFPTLSIKFWEREMLLWIAATVRTPKFIDNNCTEEALRGGYARACIQIDLTKSLRPGIDIVAKR